MKKWINLIINIFCILVWVAELIAYCIVGTISSAAIIVAMLLAIGFFIQSLIIDCFFDFSKK